MRRSVSADSIVSQKTHNINRILPALIKQSRCKVFNRYKACVLISGSVLMSCYSITNDFNFQILGVLLTSGYFSINLGFSYVENYLNQMDEWRLQEAEYEDKLDPPEWNWKIVNYTNHLAIVFNLLACIVDVDNQYFYLGCGFQLISFCLRLHNNYKSTKNLIICFMDLVSMILFSINKINGINSLLLIFPGTYLNIVAELISI
jgi:hypothetical protein